MKMPRLIEVARRLSACLALACALTSCGSAPAHQDAAQPGAVAVDPLPSWNDTAQKKAIVDFVRKTTTAGSADFVPPSERIAVFDDDGTLWIEQPAYVQFVFALQRLQALAPQHPEWRTQEPYRSALAGNMTGVFFKNGEANAKKLIMATHAGMSSDQFAAQARDWLASARDKRFGRTYPELVYQPMLEVLSYMRANGFKTYIVSGGGVEFMRGFADRAYGIPPEQVIGSSIKYQYTEVAGQPTLMRIGKVENVDDGPGKPATIQRVIGRRPVAAFGNSDGDLQMLRWTTSGTGARLGVIIHHTDAAREYAYDRTSKVGKLDKALDAASGNGWIVVDMKQDWNRMFPGN
ncbi:Tat pathway signal sequence domain-containing protein [Caballeronia arationis]|jgi:phosphoserine phosphatase|uniref:Phosphoserine phosphatase n=2 Tax=Caballeronia arationis TaxID=1777142 RepID=A0A7Z7I3J2_9BURK|nr:Tat pathway signal sequence domain-containing protein [Caballeronia arationis]SOE56857.1 Phosphoserine phosphatase [Caballeronia arationis]